MTADRAATLRSRLVNLTPHPVEVADAEGRTLLTLLPEAEGARVPLERRLEAELQLDDAQVPIWRSVAGEVQGLPPPQPDAWLVVARLVADAVARSGVRRDDLLIPDDLIRDAQGRVVACRGFSLG